MTEKAYLRVVPHTANVAIMRLTKEENFDTVLITGAIEKIIKTEKPIRKLFSFYLPQNSHGLVVIRTKKTDAVLIFRSAIRRMKDIEFGDVKLSFRNLSLLTKLVWYKKKLISGFDIYGFFMQKFINEYNREPASINEFLMYLTKNGLDIYRYLSSMIISNIGWLVISNMPSKRRLELPELKIIRENTVLGAKRYNLVRGYFMNRLTKLRDKFFEWRKLNTLTLGERGNYLCILPDEKRKDAERIEKEIREKLKKLEEHINAFIQYGEIPEEVWEKIEQTEQRYKKGGVPIKIAIDLDYPRKLRAALKEEYTKIIEQDATEIRRLIKQIFESIPYVREQMKRNGMEHINIDYDKVRAELPAHSDMIKRNLYEISQRLSNLAHVTPGDDCNEYHASVRSLIRYGLHKPIALFETLRSLAQYTNKLLSNLDEFEPELPKVELARHFYIKLYPFTWKRPQDIGEEEIISGMINDIKKDIDKELTDMVLKALDFAVYTSIRGVSRQVRTLETRLSTLIEITDAIGYDDAFEVLVIIKNLITALKLRNTYNRDVNIERLKNSKWFKEQNILPYK